MSLQITTDASVDGSDIAGFVNKLLTEENDRLQKEVSQLENENEFMRQQVNIVSLSLFSFIHYYIFFVN
jgi:hypothetical protein